MPPAGIIPVEHMSPQQRRNALFVTRTSMRNVYFEFERESMSFAKVRRRLVQQAHDLLVETDYEAEEVQEKCRYVKQLLNNILTSCTISWSTEAAASGPDDYVIIESISELGAQLEHAARASTLFAKLFCCP